MFNLVDLHLMIVTFTMIDTDSGEILARNTKNYVLNFSTANDAGFACIKRWIESSIRGIRCAGHHNIELRTHFSKEKQIPFIPDFE